MRRSNARSKKPVESSEPTMDSSKPRLPSSSKRRRPRLLLLLTLCLSVLFCIVYFFIFRNSNPVKFSVIIDAGSTGSRIHIIGFRPDRKSRNPIPVMIDFGITDSKKSTPGLSSYSSDPENSGESLVGLIDFAKERIKKENWGETEIRLLATAGLRLLNQEIKERILDSCRKVLKDSPFIFHENWATVISGADEGIYGWIAANYALGTLGSDPGYTAGIFELGGASAQVTFVTSEVLPQEFSYFLKFGDVNYNLYSHSFLHLGQNVAYDSLHDLLSGKSKDKGIYGNPCAPKGYLTGAKSSTILNSYSLGNFSQCRNAAFSLLQKGKESCIYPQCHLGSAFIPKLNGRFLATENFYYTSKFFGSQFLSELIMAGEQFCNEDWSKIKKKYKLINDEELILYCFSSAYIVALLHDTLGISIHDQRVEFVNRVGDISVDWALGAFIMIQANNNNDDIINDSNWINGFISFDSSDLFYYVLVPAFLIFMIWCFLRCKRPQFKTIYDLEKGRYILTRIKR
ncbi:hypothetical protein LUZ60_003105 [Juncus effusus]|nr:hypothetical protein LUZ60_003105 [Juncus effusus]